MSVLSICGTNSWRVEHTLVQIIALLTAGRTRGTGGALTGRSLLLRLSAEFGSEAGEFIHCKYRSGQSRLADVVYERRGLRNGMDEQEELEGAELNRTGKLGVHHIP